MRRKHWAFDYVVAVGVLLLFVGSIYGLLYVRHRMGLTEWPKRLGELRATSATAAPVLAALRRYTQAKGKPPAKLSDLVPGYLPAVPAPGPVSQSGSWYYNPQAEGQPKGVWVLGIKLRDDFCTHSGFSFGDYYVYHSNEVYPEAGYGGGLEKVGAWGYYHE